MKGCTFSGDNLKVKKRNEARVHGTHNFTIDTLVSIETALDAPILEVCHAKKYSINELEPIAAAEPT